MNVYRVELNVGTPHYGRGRPAQPRREVWIVPAEDAPHATGLAIERSRYPTRLLAGAPELITEPIRVAFHALL